MLELQRPSEECPINQEHLLATFFLHLIYFFFLFLLFSYTCMLSSDTYTLKAGFLYEYSTETQLDNYIPIMVV